jgi:glycosyltransferase involved in cell wall biosynthesis
MTNLKSISAVLPAYNEEANIPRAIHNVCSVLKPMFDNYEVIVVNDGSTDRTGEIADSLAQKDNIHIRVLHHNSNKGYGAALRTGLFSAFYEYVFYTDSDNQFDISELRHFLPLMERYDVIVGYRMKRQDSMMRIFLSWGYNWLVFILFHIKVRDVDCSFKIFHKYVLDKITIECNDFFVDTEIIARVVKAGFRIAERGVNHFPRQYGKTTVRASHIPRTLKTVFRMWKHIYIEKR